MQDRPQASRWTTEHKAESKRATLDFNAGCAALAPRSVFSLNRATDQTAELWRCALRQTGYNTRLQCRPLWLHTGHSWRSCNLFRLRCRRDKCDQQDRPDRPASKLDPTKPELTLRVLVQAGFFQKIVSMSFSRTADDRHANTAHGWSVRIDNMATSASNLSDATDGFRN